MLASTHHLGGTAGGGRPVATALTKESLQKLERPQQIPLPSGSEITPFPRIRSILWNRAYVGEPTSLVAPELRVSVGVEPAKLLSAAFHSRLNGSFLHGSVARGKNALTVRVDRFDPGREARQDDDIAEDGSSSSSVGDDSEVARRRRQQDRQVPMVALPGDYTIPIHPASYRSTRTAEACDKVLHCCKSGITTVGDVFAVGGECINIGASANTTSTANTSRRAGGQVKLTLNAVCPDTVFTAVAVPQLPVVRSGLVRKIIMITDARSTLSSSEPEVGFLTMDSTRNVVLIQGNDPQLETRPIIGAYAAAVDGLSDPMVWAACLQFIHSSKVHDRATMQDGSFLLAVYTSVARKDSTVDAPFRNSAAFYEVREDTHAKPGADGILTLSDETLLDPGITSASDDNNNNSDSRLPVSLRLVRRVAPPASNTSISARTSIAQNILAAVSVGGADTADASLDGYLGMVSEDDDATGGGADTADASLDGYLYLGMVSEDDDATGSGADDNISNDAGVIMQNSTGYCSADVDAGASAAAVAAAEVEDEEDEEDEEEERGLQQMGAEESFVVASDTTVPLSLGNNGDAFEAEREPADASEEPKFPPTPSALAPHPAVDVSEFDSLRLSVRGSVFGDDILRTSPLATTKEFAANFAAADDFAAEFAGGGAVAAVAANDATIESVGSLQDGGDDDGGDRGAVDLTAVIESMQREIDTLRDQLAKANQQVCALTNAGRPAQSAAASAAATATTGTSNPFPSPAETLVPTQCCEMSTQTDTVAARSPAPIPAPAPAPAPAVLTESPLPTPPRFAPSTQGVYLASQTIPAAATDADAVVHSAVEQVQNLLEGLLKAAPQHTFQANGSHATLLPTHLPAMPSITAPYNLPCNIYPNDPDVVLNDLKPDSGPGIPCSESGSASLAWSMASTYDGGSSRRLLTALEATNIQAAAGGDAAAATVAAVAIPSPSRMLVRKVIKVSTDDDDSCKRERAYAGIPAASAALTGAAATAATEIADDQWLLARAEARHADATPAGRAFGGAHRVAAAANPHAAANPGHNHERAPALAPTPSASMAEAVAVAEAAGYVASALPPALWQSKPSSSSMGASGADWGSGSTDSSALGSSGPSLDSSMLYTGMLESTPAVANAYFGVEHGNQQQHPFSTAAGNATEAEELASADTSLYRQKADAIMRKYLGDAADAAPSPSPSLSVAAAAFGAANADWSGTMMILDPARINALPKLT